MLQSDKTTESGHTKKIKGILLGSASAALRKIVSANLMLDRIVCDCSTACFKIVKIPKDEVKHNKIYQTN